MSKDKIFLNGMTFVAEPVAFPLSFGSRDSFLLDGTLSDDEYLFGDLSFLGDSSDLGPSFVGLREQYGAGGVPYYPSMGGSSSDGMSFFRRSVNTLRVYLSKGQRGDVHFPVYLDSSINVLKGVFFKDIYIEGDVTKNFYFSGVRLRLVSEFIPLDDRF
ncbi:hypothetical protein [Tenacibaculum finnmarkense]|uniref:hypothetical protein n=1 Tax=Tenacibaculum finnmarkense TaxID=2781243 RepID=UPI001EFBA662|nr:hypothetical protein [Tenacibaculum finnmarkense]MCG8734176.1 hypothetical protein [Tenacibaculum finnmarkense]